jgi:hypothetical protein
MPAMLRMVDTGISRLAIGNETNASGMRMGFRQRWQRPETGEHVARYGQSG